MLCCPPPVDSFNRSWYSNKCRRTYRNVAHHHSATFTATLRRMVLGTIRQYVKQNHSLAESIEQVLFRHKVSLTQYADLSTLKIRIRRFLVRIRQQQYKTNQTKIVVVVPSSSTCVVNKNMHSLFFLNNNEDLTRHLFSFLTCAERIQCESINKFTLSLLPPTIRHLRVVGNGMLSEEISRRLSQKYPLTTRLEIVLTKTTIGSLRQRFNFPQLVSFQISSGAIVPNKSQQLVALELLRMVVEAHGALQDLDVSGNYLGDGLPLGICNLLENGQCLGMLKTLNLRRNCLTMSALQHLANSLKVRKDINLKSVFIGENDL